MPTTLAPHTQAPADCVEPREPTLTDQDVALVARLYSLLRTDPAAMLPALDREVEWVNHDGVDPRPHRGHEGVKRMLHELEEPFEHYRHEPLELRRRGAEAIVVVDFRARLRDRGAEVRQKHSHVWTISDGRVVRIEWGRLDSFGVSM